MQYLPFSFSGNKPGADKNSMVMKLLPADRMLHKDPLELVPVPLPNPGLPFLGFIPKKRFLSQHKWAKKYQNIRF